MADVLQLHQIIQVTHITSRISKLQTPLNICRSSTAASSHCEKKLANTCAQNVLKTK